MDRIAEAVRSMVAWTITAFAPCIISQTSKEPHGTAQRTLAQSTTSILPWYVPRSFSLVKPCWVTEVVDET